MSLQAWYYLLWYVDCHLCDHDHLPAYSYIYSPTYLCMIYLHNWLSIWCKLWYLKRLADSDYEAYARLEGSQSSTVMATSRFHSSSRFHCCEPVRSFCLYSFVNCWHRYRPGSNFPRSFIFCIEVMYIHHFKIDIYLNRYDTTNYYISIERERGGVLWA